MPFSKGETIVAKIDIVNMERVEKERNRVHELARATYTVFMVDGEKYFQIDTYGRSDREMPDKISQSIQLDQESAARLTELLQQEF